MRIGINASFLRKSATGIGQVSLNLIRDLATKQLPHEFFLYLEEDIDFDLPQNFHKRIFLPIWKRDDLVRKIWWEKFLLPQKAKQDKCDFFVSLYQCPTVFSQKMKHVMIVHDIIPEILPEYLNNFRKKIYWRETKKAITKTNKIISVSKRTEKDLVSRLGIGPQKITVSHIDVDEIYKKNVSMEKSLAVMKKYGIVSGYIYSGGGLESRKNVDKIIHAYKHLWEENKKTHFIHDFPKLIISGKLMPSLAPLVTDVEKLVAKLNLSQQVQLLDFVPQEDLPAIYHNSIFFIFPSRYEGFGLPVLEAMNMGVPTITSKKTSLPEVGGDSVLYCEENDHRDIAMVMRNMLTNSHLRNELARRGRERAKMFSWEKFSEKFINILKNI